MKKQGLIILYFLLLLTDILALETHNRILESIAKPLLMPVLAIYFLSCTGGNNRFLSRWILAALVFSLAGDVFLLSQDRVSVFFLYGLASFLLAHIFYILFFQQLRIQEATGLRTVLLVPVVIYYAGLIAWLTPYLGTLKIPVWVYGLVISTMLMLALHMPRTRFRRAGLWMMAGALLFVVSDSILAVNKFYRPFDRAGLVIMLTYGLAQYGIVKGAADYIRAGRST
ncbi:MAG: lysoplasmalogenase [Chitinophagaceae bacterium]